MHSSDTLAAVAPVVDALERLGVTYYLGGSVVSSAALNRLQRTTTYHA